MVKPSQASDTHALPGHDKSSIRKTRWLLFFRLNSKVSEVPWQEGSSLSHSKSSMGWFSCLFKMLRIKKHTHTLLSLKMTIWYCLGGTCDCIIKNRCAPSYSSRGARSVWTARLQLRSKFTWNVNNGIHENWTELIRITKLSVVQLFMLGDTLVTTEKSNIRREGPRQDTLFNAGSGLFSNQHQ